MLTGRFDTSEQAQADKAYYAIQLQTCVVDAPELGSRVLYVEQAMMAKLGAPYRQRLYVIDAAESSNGAVASRVYELAAPKAAVGLCANPGAKTFLAADALPREGCTVTLGWDAMATAFTGGTTGKECASSLNGAAYATSEVTLNASGLESWDRGFDAGGQQVWGAVKGPYRFARRTPIGE